MVRGGAGLCTLGNPHRTGLKQPSFLYIELTGQVFKQNPSFTAASLFSQAVHETLSMHLFSLLTYEQLLTEDAPLGIIES